MTVSRGTIERVRKLADEIERRAAPRQPYIRYEMPKPGEIVTQPFALMPKPCASFEEWIARYGPRRERKDG